jgi:CTP:molybdopterin cytidylyltransferase MocA
LFAFEVSRWSEADEGMASSIRTGGAISVGDVLLLVCDRPAVTAVRLRAFADVEFGLR